MSELHAQTMENHEQISELKDRIKALETLLNRKIRLTGQHSDYLNKIQDKFFQLSKGKSFLNLNDLKLGFSLKSEFITQQIFRVLDQDQDGRLSEDEFLGSIEELLLGSEEAKLRFMFKVMDQNNDGVVGESEFNHFLKESSVECGLQLSETKLAALSRAFFHDESHECERTLDFSCYRQVMNQSPDLLTKTRIASTGWLMPPTQQPLLRKPSWLQRWLNVFNNNRCTFAFMAVYALANGLLFFGAMNEYASQGANWMVQIARGCGACLNFNAMLILLPMVRYLTTWVRSTWLIKVIPVNQSLQFHRIAGHWMMILSLVHTAAHLGNYTTLSNSIAFYLTQTQAGATGLALLVVFGAMWFVALKAIKKVIPFETFYIVHLGYVLWFALALFHGPNLWLWVMVPVVLFAIEKLYRNIKGSQTLEIENIECLKSGVTKISIRKDNSFQHNAGDYLFLKLPFISNFDWHPFTISSIPSDRQITLHVRSVGNWTEKLHQHFQHHPFEPRDIYRARIDGPFSTPSCEINQVETAILIANGIGVTPFAAILKDLLHAHQQADTGYNQLKKVHFIWINRNQQAFEWFTQLLKEMEVSDCQNFIESRFYMTGGKYDLSTSALNSALDLYYQQQGKDLITGLKSKTVMERPEWQTIFKDLRKKHPGEVDVFVCGNDTMASDINRQCNLHGFHFHKEVF